MSNEHGMLQCQPNHNLIQPRSGYDGGALGNVTFACNAPEGCLRTADVGGVVDGLEDACNADNACEGAARDDGEICGIRSACNARAACRNAGRDGTICPGLIDCCDAAEECQGATAAPATCAGQTAAPTLSPLAANETRAPSRAPTPAPTAEEPVPLTYAPTSFPTGSAAPTKAPTRAPAAVATEVPTRAPTKAPTREPTSASSVTVVSRLTFTNLPIPEDESDLNALTADLEGVVAGVIAGNLASGARRLQTTVDDTTVEVLAIGVDALTDDTVVRFEIQQAFGSFDGDAEELRLDVAEALSLEDTREALDEEGLRAEYGDFTLGKIETSLNEEVNLIAETGVRTRHAFFAPLSNFVVLSSPALTMCNCYCGTGSGSPHQEAHQAPYQAPYQEAY